MISIPLCHKCSRKKCSDSKNDRGMSYKTIDGCLDLTQEEWDAGQRPDETGLTYQHNCPMMKELNKEMAE